MKEPVELISLSELIEKVKADLVGRVGSEGPDSPFLYVDTIEITAQVVARREKGEGGNAGLSLSVLGLKADAGIDTKTTVGKQLTQSVTIKLSPLLTKAEYLERLTSEQRAEIARTAAKSIARGLDQGGGEQA